MGGGAKRMEIPLTKIGLTKRSYAHAGFSRATLQPRIAPERAPQPRYLANLFRATHVGKQHARCAGKLSKSKSNWRSATANKVIVGAVKFAPSSENGHRGAAGNCVGYRNTCVAVACKSPSMSLGGSPGGPPAPPRCLRGVRLPPRSRNTCF